MLSQKIHLPFPYSQKATGKMYSSLPKEETNQDPWKIGQRQERGGKNSHNEDDGNFPNHSCVANPGGKQSVSAFWRTEKSKIAESQRHSKEKVRAWYVWLY